MFTQAPKNLVTWLYQVRKCILNTAMDILNAAKCILNEEMNVLNNAMDILNE